MNLTSFHPIDYDATESDGEAAMRNLYLVTHPEATHHVEKLVGGWYDSSLTAQGQKDAGKVARALRERIPAGNQTLLFSSDLLRTRQTAEPVAESLGLEVVSDVDLREQSYGVAEGAPVGSIPFIAPPAFGDRLRHRDGVDGSESRFELASRAYGALRRILASKAKDIIVVTHGGTATYLVAAWIGLPLEDAGYVKFKMSPGGISHLREDEFFHDRQVVSLNDLKHLDR